MNDWRELEYGENIAPVYDSIIASEVNTDDAVAFLTELAAEHDAHTLLELGSGTGRLLFPLQAAGLEVAGIELSPAMIERMRAKPGGAQLDVLVGDMTEFELDRRFDLILIAFNTLYCLDSSERQRACLRTAAGHLSPGGLLVIETHLPYPLTRMPARGMTPLALDHGRAVLAAYRHDQLGQVIETTAIILSSDGIGVYPNRNRYAWPAELDLMAELSGLTLLERFADWNKAPFTGYVDSQLCLYEAARRSGPK
ncbi:MAG TPA: class I SAM-dependent methyltransferase [Gaiellaceae bacterium]|nr:class I SAM-dependent methyltransferase [Gaiellaceae bacterium]